MHLLLMVVEAVGLIVGSLIAAVLLCCSLWRVFHHARQLEWEALVFVILLVLAFVGAIPNSPFLQMTLVFTALALAPIRFADHASCRECKPRPAESMVQGVFPTSVVSAQSSEGSSPYRLYPAITACICEARRPTRDEIHVVASRLWREGLKYRFGANASSASFAARRILVRAAIAALSGRNPETRTR